MLSQKEMKLLTETRDLLGDLLETMEIMEDEELMGDIEEAQRDVESGRTQDFEEFLKKLD